MSFAAEPFGVFVDDLLSGLTGGVTREELVFGASDTPLRLGFGDDFVPGTVRVWGLAEGQYRRFVDGVDFTVDAGGVVTFLAASPGVPKAGATWPDRGSRFYTSYERKPEGRPAPRLTDRNPGSIVRTLAESFAREYAVLSRQMELVYEAGFVDTAKGRDLDQLAALVGVERRGRTFATGEVVFSRLGPAPADIFIPEGTRLSTAEVPAVTVETSEPRTLRAGTVSVSAPVQSLVAGPDGAAPPGSLTVIHRPILGIDSVGNPQPLTFGGGDETDVAVRRRVKRALETSGRATTGSLVGALMTLEGVREQDIRVVEDHLAHPGIVKLQVAATLDEAARRRAAELIRDHRPAGVRVEHDLGVPPTPAPGSGAGGGGGGSGGGTSPPAESDPIFFDVDVTARVTPAQVLTPAQKANLQAKVEAALRGAVDRCGIGETVVYNRLLAEVMAIEGIYDVDLDVYAAGSTTATGRINLAPSPRDRRPRPRMVNVVMRGALVALDVSVVFEFLVEPVGDRAAAVATVREDLAQRLADVLAGAGLPTIDPATLVAHLPEVATYKVDAVSYSAELVEDGLRILQTDVPLTLEVEQQPWVRSVAASEKVVISG